MNRARLVAAVAFAAAALVGASLVMLTGGTLSLALPGMGVVLGVVGMTLSLVVLAAGLGAFAAPLLSRMPDGRRAAGVGVGMTVVVMVLYVVSAIAFAAFGSPTAFDHSDVPLWLGFGAVAAVVIGLVASPLGATAAFFAWLWMRRDAPTDAA